MQENSGWVGGRGLYDGGHSTSEMWPAPSVRLFVGLYGNKNM